MKNNQRSIHTGASETPHSFYISHYGPLIKNTVYYRAEGFHIKNTSDTAVTVSAKTASMDSPVLTTIAPFSWSEERFVYMGANASEALQYGY